MYRTEVDLNCDIGEGFGHQTYRDAPDAALMAVVTSSNVAIAFHAGDPDIIDDSARLG